MNAERGKAAHERVFAATTAVIAVAFFALALSLGATSCASVESAKPPSNVRATPAAVFGRMGDPIPGINGAALARFERGREVARRRFSPTAGLGPEYNAVACGSCHEKPVLGGGASRYRTVFLSPNSSGGGTSAFRLTFEHHFTVNSIPPPRANNGVAQRIPPPIFGMGLLAEIPASEILRHADPNDADSDGVRGHVNFERGFIGRFGRKAQMSSLQGFVRLALLDHMGITTVPAAELDLHEADAPLELATSDADEHPDPELPPNELSDLLSFVALLAPPVPSPPDEQSRQGERLFRETGCAACHLPALSGPRGEIAAFTDLLLHDMGRDLADDVAISEASGSEFRTQPLWGVAVVGPYLHDGRADTLEEAIRFHGGEAERSRDRFLNLSSAEQGALVAFLGSLGGSDQRADGLLPTQPVIPAVGELGGPLVDLSGSPADRERFERGRVLFDHDFRRSEGLGGLFNGDACRSCHFDPVIGGAGPADVDAVRHGIWGPDGFRAATPDGETLAPRFAIERGQRPRVDGRANLFERRQTPSLLGLGLLDAIADEAIAANADPLDKDGDGVRGVVSVLVDRRVGRFGWKAQTASLEDFVADAFAHELGVVPPHPSFEKSTSVAELSREDFDAITFFLRSLAPPRVASRDGEDVMQAGEALFVKVGCATCHVPELRTRDGRAVRLYSDLLLHDVAPTETPLVSSPGRGFRTPPLWGIAMSAPYLHDGRAETIDAAIRAHESEAHASRARYLSITDAERASLVQFVVSR